MKRQIGFVLIASMAEQTAWIKRSFPVFLSVSPMRESPSTAVRKQPRLHYYNIIPQFVYWVMWAYPLGDSMGCENSWERRTSFKGASWWLCELQGLVRHSTFRQGQNDKINQVSWAIMRYLNKVVLLTNLNKESSTAAVCDVEADHMFFTFCFKHIADS